MNTIRHLDLTVIMPIAPGANPKPAIRAIERSIPKGTTAELITVTGTHPTRQRNLAAHRANGRILWFLDHDAIPAPDAASMLLCEFRNPKVAVVGGPNLAARPRTAFESRAGKAIASRWGSPFVSDRYRQHGKPRSVSEHSLILCNLMVRREAFLSAGGFDPRLYPNEENELMNRMSGAGIRMILVPAAAVMKNRPASVAALVREALRYGRGRANQVWLNPVLRDVVHIAGALAFISLLVAGASHPWQSLAALGLLSVFTLDGILFDLFPGFSLGIVRLAGYAAGLSFGLLNGWRARAIRLGDIPAQLSSFLFHSGRFRLSESSSFDLGSITMKGAFRHA